MFSDHKGIKLKLKDNMKISKHTEYFLKKKPIRKWANGMTRHFTDKDIQMAYKLLKKHSTSLDVKELYIRTAMRHHYLTIKMTKIKK